MNNLPRVVVQNGFKAFVGKNGFGSATILNGRRVYAKDYEASKVDGLIDFEEPNEVDFAKEMGWTR